MHSARSIVRTAATAVRAGARAQSNAAAPAIAAKTGPSFVDTFFYDAPDQNELDETFPGVPAITGKLQAPTKVQVSKLPNGITVVSQDAHRGASTVGVYVKGGARTESAPGAAFAVQQLAFGATQKRSALKLFRDVDVFGGHLQATAGKEVTSFVASATRDALPELTTAIAETLTAPKLDSWELAEASYWATSKLEALKAAPGAALSADVAAAVFGEASPLGHHALPSAQQWGKLSTGDVKDFLSAHVQGNNMVLAGVNVDHSTLVEQADLLLMGVPEGAPTKFASIAPRGGEYITRSETSSAALGLGFGLTGLDAKAQAAVAVLTAALGGASGPRPFTSVRKNALSTLAEKIAHGESKLPAGSKLVAASQQYSDATLLSFQGATTGAAAGDWLALAISTLKDIASGKLTEEEIARAKSVAALDAVGPLSGISGLRNDMGSQLVLSGKHSDAAAQVAAFAAISKADVEKAAATVLKSGVPGVAVQGNAASVPRFDALAASML